MNYSGKTIGITGHSGFIGRALVQEFAKDETINLVTLDGDVRNPALFGQLNHQFDYLFHFAAPSSQVLFKRQPLYCADVTINGFINAAKLCREYGIKLIYPSTGLLSSPQRNEYARCKEICEDIAAGGIDALGLRIFATYGPGEGHKRDYASVPYLFARDMVAGRQPVVFGDGNQTRDFIYIDDVVQSILTLAETCPDPVVDIGSGESVSFNQIIEWINKHKTRGTAIKPVYIERPAGYVNETAADPSRLHDFYQPQVTLEAGIKKLLQHLYEVQK